MKENEMRQKNGQKMDELKWDENSWRSDENG